MFVTLGCEALPKSNWLNGRGWLWLAPTRGHSRCVPCIFRLIAMHFLKWYPNWTKKFISYDIIYIKKKKKLVIPKTYYSKKILEVHFACCKKQPPKSPGRLTLQGETLEARSYQSWGLKKPISNSGCNVPQVRVWLCRALRKGNTLIRIARISTEKIAEEFKVFERPLKDIVHIVCNLPPLGVLEKKSIYF